ncbi:MAG: phospholipase D family protein [Burkholderiaceae bacterium]
MSSILPAQGQLEIAFSPNGAGTDLVVKVIESAQKSICVLGYSFTSAPIAQALVTALKRGVAVRIVLDKSQQTAQYSSATFLANQGVPLRIDSRHAIQHSKTIEVDEKTVQTGSFNYTKAAQSKNAENVLVNWNHPALGTLYRKNFETHWEHAVPYDAKALR